MSGVGRAILSGHSRAWRYAFSHLNFNVVPTGGIFGKAIDLHIDTGTKMRPDASNNLWPFASKKIMISLLSACLSLALAGCGDPSLRTGISPVLDVVSVQSAAINQATIIDALATDAGLTLGDPRYYYGAAEAGFNYVDDQCSAYFDYMFFLDRRRDELKSGLAAAAATTGAILGVTNASTMSLAIVASAFGFASNATDIVAGTYVFAHPAESKVLVNTFQKAFRDGIALNSGAINSRTSAYYAVQRYLNLCLPPTIEAQIARQVAATVAVPVAAGPGSLVSLQSGSSLPQQQAILKHEVESKRISNVKSAANTSKPSTEVRESARDKFIRATKIALCVPETDASLSPATVLAIKDYLRAMTRPVPTGQVEPFDPAIEPDLSMAISQVKDCKALVFETAFEVGAFGVIENSSDPAKDRSVSIKDIQSKINAGLKENKSSTVIAETGTFDTQTRDAISELRNLLKLSPGRMIDLPLDKYLNLLNKGANQ
jgi:hypothetical protein